MMELWTNFHFLRPWWGLLLLPWLGVMLILLGKTASHQQPARTIAPHLLPHLIVKPSRQSNIITTAKLSLLLLALALLILMGPSWRQQALPLNQDKAVLLVALDASTSMQQADLSPSRLARAKYKVQQLLTQRIGSKTALLAYAGSAHTVLTPTADTALFNTYLDAITTDIMPRSGKYPEYLIPHIATMSNNNSPITLLLITDGLGQDSAAALTAFFQRHNHQLLIWGIGTDRADIPLEHQQLQQLADATDGQFIAVQQDDSDIERLTRLIDHYYIRHTDSRLPWEDAGYYLVFPCLLLFLAWTRRDWGQYWRHHGTIKSLSFGGLLLLAMTTATVSPHTTAADSSSNATDHIPWWRSFVDGWLSPDQQGQLLLQQGQYRAAAQRFESHQWKAVAWYYAEEFMLAAHYFSRADSIDALFNQANSRAQARDYLRAVALYDEVLERDPKYPGASNNRAQVQALIDAINQLNDSQQNEAGVSSEELSDNDPRAAEGRSELNWKTPDTHTLKADDVLQQAQLRAMWLKTVERDPGEFLASKFSRQQQARQP